MTGTIQSSIPADTTPVCLGSQSQSDTGVKEQLNIEETIVKGPRQYRTRKDSGYSETTRRPVYQLPFNNGSLTFLELRKNVGESARPKDLASRHGRSTTRHKSKSSVGVSEHLQSEAQAKDDILPFSSTTRDQLESADSVEILCRPHKSPRQSVSVEQRIPAENHILVYAKSMSTVETLELPEYFVSSSETSRSPSPSRVANSFDVFLGERSDSSATASILDMETHPFPSLHVATNIDWTNPSTRQRIYEKHDRDQQAIRRWFRKIIPRKLQGERVNFYDGNSDTCSVRRYRLDIDRTSMQDVTRDKTKLIRHALSCLSLLRSTSRLRS